MSDKAILCVDDEKMILNSLKNQLRKHYGSRFHLEFAEGADEAFEVIDQLVEKGVKIVIIVSDWLMPGMKGDEFLQIVNQKYPGIVKIMLTGQADEEAIRRSYEKAYLFELIHKPWTEEELIGKLNAGLEKLDDINF